MPLPTRLKSARMTNATAASSIDNEVGNLEQAVADLMGIAIDTDYSSPVVGAANKYSQSTDGNTVSNTAVETAITKTYTIPANTLAPGDIVRWGTTIEVAIGVVHDLNIKARFGGTGGTVIWTGNLNPPGPGIVGVECAMVCRTIGVAGLFLPTNQGNLWNGLYGLGNPVPAGTTSTRDTTAGITVDFTFQWGGAAAADSWTQKTFWAKIERALSTS
jgi:hypothetical protein